MIKNQLTSNRISARRIGRGGKRGKTSGRGMKGAGARAGNKGRPELRDIIKKIPKRRGYGKNRARTVVPKGIRQSVNLDQLERAFDAGSVVSPKALVVLGLARRESGKLPTVKLLGRGSLTKALTVSGLNTSASARAAIVKAGGTVQAPPARQTS